MTEAEQAAEKLETALIEDDTALAREQFNAIQAQCTQCHKAHRN